MRLVVYHGGSNPKAGHLLLESWAGDKTLCGRIWPGARGKVRTTVYNLHLCGNCHAVLKNKFRIGERL